MNTEYNDASNILEQLRSTTASAHEALENLPVSKNIISTDVTKEQYLLYLQSMYEVISDVEQNVYPLLDTIIDTPLRTKRHLIEQDLNTLGVSAQCTKKPITESGFKNTPAFALGIMYVTEGSTLGGKFIYKNINSVLGYDDNSGASYFAGYGKITGSMWKKFLNTLTEYSKNNNYKKIIDGAVFGFNKIKNQLN